MFLALGDRSARPEGRYIAVCACCEGREAVGAAIAAAAGRGEASLTGGVDRA